jgi:hypothetical protein
VRREPRTVPRFARDDHRPGEAVEGVLEVVAPLGDVRRLDAYLKYVDRSPNLSGAVTHAAAEPLHEGPLEVGAHVPFALPLPADALPNWDHPATAELGTLSWALVVEADIGGGLDTITTHAVPVARDGVWPGPAPGPDGQVMESGGGWDVTIAPDRWSLRRGETVTVDIHIGEPAPGRDSFKVGLMCQADSRVETTRPGEAASRRETRTRTLFELWPEIDPSQPAQQVWFTLPADGPFSYDGSAFGFRWFVLAREAKPLRSDPHRSARLQILP